jgi:hypothetical protein
VLVVSVAVASVVVASVVVASVVGRVLVGRVLVVVSDTLSSPPEQALATNNVETTNIGSFIALNLPGQPGAV